MTVTVRHALKTPGNEQTVEEDAKGDRPVWQLIILLVVLGLLNMLTVQTTYYEINAVLDYIIQYDGHVPKKEKPQIPNNTFIRQPNFNEETAFQIRYFTVIVDSNNQITSIEDSNIEALTTDEIRAHAENIIKSGSTSGSFSDDQQMYNYKSITKPDGTRLIVALDSTHYWYSVNHVIRQSFWLGLGSLFFFVLVLTFLSNLAIRPEIRNMENQKRFIPRGKNRHCPQSSRAYKTQRFCLSRCRNHDPASD